MKTGAGGPKTAEGLRGCLMRVTEADGDSWLSVAPTQRESCICRWVHAGEHGAGPPRHFCRKPSPAVIVVSVIYEKRCVEFDRSASVWQAVCLKRRRNRRGGGVGGVGG